MFYPDTKNFVLSEILPPQIISKFGSSGRMFLSPLVCISLQQLRNRFGRIRCNSKALGFTQRALRTYDYYVAIEKPKGGDWELRALRRYAKYWGQHKLGNAFDVDFLDAKLEDVLKYIEENPDEFPFITFIEVDITWFHFDCRNIPFLEFWSPAVVDGKTRGTVKIVDKQPIQWEKIVDIKGDNFKGLNKV